MRSPSVACGLVLVCGVWIAMPEHLSLPSLAVGSERGTYGDPADVIVSGVTPARSRGIAERAIAVKHEIEATLFGATKSRPWVPPCTIHVHPDRASFAGAVGGAPPGVEGATSIEFVGDVVRRRRIDVLDSKDGGIPDAVAHELVHVVLADRFTDRAPPRWADEGLATLFDSPSKQRGHEADFRAALDHGQAWRLADLMSLEREPAGSTRLRVFYGQSAAVVRWLLARANGPTFMRFLDDADSEGAALEPLERSLRRHYRLDSLAELEKAWLEAPAAVVAGENP